MGKLTGWIAILLALFAMVIGIVPGAVSLMGIAVSMSAVLLSLYSIRKNGCQYFGVTAALAWIGTFLSNDSLRIWSSVPMPSAIKFAMYGVVFLVFATSAFAAYYLGLARCDLSARLDPESPAQGRLP